MSAATLPPCSQTTLRPFSSEMWDEIFAPFREEIHEILREGMEEIHEILQSKTSTSMSLPPESLAQPSIGHIQDPQTDDVQDISETSPPFNLSPCKTPCPSVPDPLPLLFKDEVEVSEHPLRLLDNPIDTTLSVLSRVTVPPNCSFPSGTLDITSHPNAMSHETAEGKYTSRGHDIQNAIMGIMDQSMCCPKNFPLCATEATLALSFPRHGPDQKTHCPPSTGQDLGRLLQTALALSFSKHGPDIRLLATSVEALLQFVKSFCMTLQPARQIPGIRMAEGLEAYGRLQPVRRPWF